MMPTEQVVLDKFDGGFQPDGQPGALLENQWGELKGFIFDRERKVRSQWAVQQVGSETDWVWVEEFIGNQSTYLLAMNTAGVVKWTVAPADDAAYTVANAITWNTITTVPTNSRAIGLVLQDTADGVVNAMMVGKQGAASVFIFYENTLATAIVHTEITDVYPDDPTPVTDEFGQTGFENLDADAIPTANVAAMWGDQVVLADVTVKVDASLPLDAGNATRGRNALWVSEPGNYDTFNPTNGITYVASQEATIIDVVEVDIGLLVFTTVADRQYDGVILLRGAPASYEVVPLRAGIGPSINLVEATEISQEGPNITWWGEVGSVVFPGQEGGIWHTQGDGLDRLDHYGPERYPSDLTTDDWYVKGFREQVILSRPDGVLCLRVFEESGAWTELVTPDVAGGPARPHYMTVAGGSCYWIDAEGGGGMWRWAPEMHAERGLIDGVDATLTVSTRTIQASPHDSTFWHRLGVVCSSPQATGTIVNVVTRPSGFDDTSKGEYTVAVNESIGPRQRLTVPAHGPSLEASASVTFTGDVVIESLAWLARGGKVER